MLLTVATIFQFTYRHDCSNNNGSSHDNLNGCYKRVWRSRIPWHPNKIKSQEKYHRCWLLCISCGRMCTIYPQRSCRCLNKMQMGVVHTMNSEFIFFEFSCLLRISDSFWHYDRPICNAKILCEGLSHGFWYFFTTIVKIKWPFVTSEQQNIE